MRIFYLTLVIISHFSNFETSIVRDNVIFHKANEIYVNDARWLVTFVHDLTPYSSFIDKIKISINETKSIINKVISFYSDKDMVGYSETFKSLDIELKLLTETYHSVQQSFDQYKKLSQRPKLNKRSILPIVGQALSVLFGTVSESDLNNINRNIKTLSQNQKHIIHDLKVGLTVLNLTRSQVSENRRAILDIVICMNKLDDKIQEVKSIFDKKYTELEKFVHTYMQFQMIIDELKVMMQNVVTYLDNLKLELSMLSMSHLSINTISPSQLRGLLFEIEKQLPINQKLPNDPNNNIWYFYKILSCQTYLFDNKIHVVLNVPLLNVKHSFEIYKIINIAIPLHTGYQVHETLSFKYKIESDTLMITKDRTKYSLLTEDESKFCLNTHTKFCNPESALYPTTLSKLCVIALFLENNKNIENYCQKVFVRHRLPSAISIHKGLWVISTQSEIKFTLNCQNMNSHVESIKPPMGIIKLNFTCSAASEHLSLPVYNEKHYHYTFNDSLSELLTFRNVTGFHIWQNMNQTKNLTSLVIPPHLRGLTEIPANSVLDDINLDYENVNSQSSDNTVWYVIVISSVSIMVILIVYFKYCKRKLCTRLANDHGVGKLARRTPDATMSDPEVIELDVPSFNNNSDRYAEGDK